MDLKDLKEIEENEESHTKLSYNIEECSLLFNIQPETKLPTPEPPKEDDTEGIMLDPDHPLLAKFQIALRDQLARQVEKLSTEVFELESGIKKKSGERDELGIAVYDAQQMVALQYESIDHYERELTKITNDRNDVEEELLSITEIHALTKNKLDQTERKEMELRNEIGAMNFMYQQVSDWEQKLQSDLAVQQRISDKTKFDRKQFTEEKRNLDFLIYKLMTEVFRLENNLDHYNMQLRVMEHERESLATSVASANADIEALENEHKRLMHSWNSVIVAVGHRDKMYNVAKKELEKEQENLQITLTEITGMKKLNNEQMGRNEELTLVKGRIDMDKTMITGKLNYNIDKLNNLEKKLTETDSILKQTNKDLDDITAEKKAKEIALEDIRREIEKNLCVKLQFEERILNLLQEQMSNDKVSKYMNKTIRDIRQNNRNLEIQFAAIENKNADLGVRIERQKVVNAEAVSYLQEMIETEKMHEQEIIEVNNKIRATQQEVTKVFRKFDETNKKFDELLQKTGGVELTPVESKIKELERNIMEFDEKNATLKTFWLRQQSYIISLKEERYQQLNELNLMKKQSMLLQQTNLKLEDELEELENQEKQFERNMKNLAFQIDKMNKTLWLQRDQKESLDTNASSFKVEFLQKLKDAELDCILLEDKLTELEEEKNTLIKDLIEFNRETLAWEKKVKMAEETKVTIKKEKSSEGELGSMKAEIHRMTVRYSQLRKAQEKLVHDLNHCVSRREFIFTVAEATEKRLCAGGNVNNRINLKRKLEDVKNKVKKTENERKCLEKKINLSLELEQQLHDKIEENDKTIEDMGTQLLDLKNYIANEKFDRQKELEVLVFKQHKLRHFTSISKRQYRPQYRSETALDNELTQVQEVNGKLQTVTENLIIDFPNHYPVFIKILNTLKVVYDN